MRKLLFPIIACAFLAMACDDSSSDSNEPSTTLKAGDKCDPKTFKATCKTDEKTQKTVAFECAMGFGFVIDTQCGSDQACLVAEDKSVAGCFKGQDDVVDSTAEKDAVYFCRTKDDEHILSWSIVKKMSDNTFRKFEYDATCSLGCNDEKSCKPVGANGVCNDEARALCEEGQKCATLGNAEVLCYKEECGKDAPIGVQRTTCSDDATSEITIDCIATDSGVVAKQEYIRECECDKETGMCKDSE